MRAAGRLLLASHRAPLEASETAAGLRVARTVGGLAAALDEAMGERGGAWIAGAGSFAGDELSPAVTGLRYPIRAVRLRERGARTFYAGFANQVLWPLCHMFPSRCRFLPAYWSAYRRANEAFAGALGASAEPGDLVWVNDFHLGLVPGLLRAAGVPARIGIFWHVPFPPPSVFGVCPWRDDLLGGLLGADVIGFQTEEDAHNFRDCAARFLDLRLAGDPPRVRLPAREVRVVSLPVGIDAAGLAAAAADPAVRARAARLRANLRADLVILAVDRLDYTKGIPERLLGFERFLDRRPEWRRRASLVQIATPSPFHVPEYREMKRAIDRTVGRILGRFTYEGRPPLVYHYTAFDHAELVAYYVAADVALVTPLRDGMNLIAKEYVACHPEGDGALVLSEFAGAARQMRDAVLVNPYDGESIRRALDTTLAMSADERRRRTRALAAQVAASDVRWWTSTFLGLLAGEADGA